MKQILLDTSIIIDFLRVGNKENRLLYRIGKVGYKLCVSIVTHTEIYSGKSIWEKIDAKEEAEKVFSGMEIFSLDEEISIKAGSLRASSNSNIIDSIIAATALHYDLELTTFNRKDFEKIQGIRLVDPLDFQE